jgi:hypothetical protein
MIAETQEKMDAAKKSRDLFMTKASLILFDNFALLTGVF